MSINDKEKKQKKAKILKILSHICLISYPLWGLVSYFFIGKFWVTGLPVMFLLAGLTFIFQGASLKAMKAAAVDNKHGYPYQTDTSQIVRENKERNPMGTYLAVMFILTYLIFVLGCLIIGSLIIIGIILNYIDNGYISLPFFTTVLLFLFAAAALYGYIALSVNMVSALIKDKNLFNLKRNNSFETMDISANIIQKRSYAKLKKAGYVFLILLLSIGIGALSIKGLIYYMPKSGHDLTFMKIFFVALAAAAFTAPVIALLASIKSHRPQITKMAVPSLYKGYLTWMKSYKNPPKIDAQIAAYEKGFLDRYEQIKKNSDGFPQKQKERPVSSLNEDFDQNLSVLEQGHVFAREINKINDLIPDEQITDDLNLICKYVNDIYKQASKDKSIERQIRKLNNIYLPQTLKFCNLYIDMQERHAETSAIIELKKQIGKSITNAKTAFANLNDNLMQQSSIDIEAEIKMFEQILTIDGLLNKQEILYPKKEEDDQ